MKPSLTLIAAIGIACLPACKKDSEPMPRAPGSATQAPVSAPPVAAAEPAAVPDAPRCQNYRDCRISCEQRDSCCGQLCQCSLAYHQEELEALIAKKRESCTAARESCPEADCIDQPTDFVARCEEGKCTALEVPRYMGKRSYTCKSSSECVVDRELENNCCGELCFATQVYHRDELAEIKAINDKRCTEEERHWCPKAKCALPATKTVAECVRGQCKGKQAPR